MKTLINDLVHRPGTIKNGIYKMSRDERRKVNRMLDHISELAVYA